MAVTRRNEAGQLVYSIPQWRIAYRPLNRDVVVSPPYSSREQAERFVREIVSEGAEAVVVLRSEHHGTLPAAEETREWDDMVPIPTLS
ncbi:MAG: hypothetical protein L0Y56_16590 [Nitrospira sp.]|nr:hypothetical protein [Nitrospira sp.]